MLKKSKLIVLGLLFSTAALADHHDHWGGHHGHHHRHHGHHRPMYREEVIYYQPAPVVEYAPAPRYYGYDQRSPQGLLGGMAGSAMGYQFGGGDPVAAGIGAAAGAWLGNGM